MKNRKKVGCKIKITKSHTVKMNNCRKNYLKKLIRSAEQLSTEHIH